MTLPFLKRCLAILFLLLISPMATQAEIELQVLPYAGVQSKELKEWLDKRVGRDSCEILEKLR